MDLQITLGITQLLVELDAKLTIPFCANFISVQKTKKKKEKRKKDCAHIVNKWKSYIMILIYHLELFLEFFG